LEDPGIDGSNVKIDLVEVRRRMDLICLAEKRER
jgi:hypothetical protein